MSSTPPVPIPARDTRRGNGRKRLREIPVYPFLIAIYPVLVLASTNISEIQIADTYRAFGLSLLATIVLLLVLTFIVRDIRRAAILCALLLIAGFSYGHIYSILKPISIGDFIVGRHRYLAPAYIGAVLVATWYIVHGKFVSPSITSILNFAVALALVPSVYAIGSTLLQFHSVQNEFADNLRSAGSELEVPSTSALADIYYIVVDAYSRSDHLKERFGYDNIGFEAFLKERGFYVATQANTNYTSTALSLGSSLNLNYYSALDIDLSLGRYPLNMRELIVHSRVRQILEELGYEIIAFPTGYNPTEIYDADYFLIPDMSKFDELRQEGSVNAFEEMLFTTTAGRLLIDIDSLLNTPLDRFISERLAAPENLQRAIVLSSFDRLSEVAELPGPKFVFAHITSPHTPYFFGPNGESVGEVGVFTFDNPNSESDWARDVPKYVDQLTYVNTRLEEAIDAILSSSEMQPIILLQSDHGPDMGLDWENPEESALLTRVGILNAYYLPKDCQDDLHPAITPVNSFRVILNCLSGPSFEMLPDISYYNPHVRSKPWDNRPFEEFLD